MSRARPALVLALCALAAALLPAARAHAGSYYVQTCQPDGTAHGWTRYDTAHAVAYIDCGSSATGAGLRTRNVITGGWAPVFSLAQLTLAAPPGAYFDWMRFDADLRAQQGWRAGIHDFQHNTWIWCGTAACTHSFGWRQVEVAMSSTNVGVLTICGDLNCGPNTETWGNFGIRNVVLRVQDPISPSLTLNGGSLLSGGWLRGTHGVSVAASDNTGVQHIRLLIDGRLDRATNSACDYHYANPCVASIATVAAAAAAAARTRIRRPLIAAR